MESFNEKNIECSSSGNNNTTSGVKITKRKREDDLEALCIDQKQLQTQIKAISLDLDQIKEHLIEFCAARVNEDASSFSQGNNHLKQLGLNCATVFSLAAPSVKAMKFDSQRMSDASARMKTTMLQAEKEFELRQRDRLVKIEEAKRIKLGTSQTVVVAQKTIFHGGMSDELIQTNHEGEVGEECSFGSSRVKNVKKDVFNEISSKVEQVMKIHRVQFVTSRESGEHHKWHTCVVLNRVKLRHCRELEQLFQSDPTHARISQLMENQRAEHEKAIRFGVSYDEIMEENRNSECGGDDQSISD
jgi:hypothetical protein